MKANDTWIVHADLLCHQLGEYQPYGYVYPDEQNCLMDKETLTVKGIFSECYLIDEIISADFSQTKLIKIISFIPPRWITMMPIPLQGKTSWNRGNQDNNLTDFDIKLGRPAASVKTDHALRQILNAHAIQPTFLFY